MVDPALFAELRDLCLRSFPERLGQRLSQVETLDSTFEFVASNGEATISGRHPTLAFTLSWQEGVRPRVERLLLRRYADDRTWWVKHDRHKAQREWSVMRWLYGSGLPIPRVYALGALDRDPFLLLERPTGQTMALGTGESKKALSGMRSQGAREHIDRLATLLARLHCLTPPSSVREVLPNVDAGKALARAAHIAEQFGAAILKGIHELMEVQVEAYPPCVLHGDPKLADCLHGARGVTAWLNWENSALGDPRWDVACVANELQRNASNPLGDRFCERYSDQAGLRLHNMTYWQAQAAICRWAVTHQVHATLNETAQLRLSTQLEQRHKQAWSALTRFRDSRATITSSDLQET
jgi:aminoglycoside phosphotransferase (APT) family kinase protein